MTSMGDMQGNESETDEKRVALKAKPTMSKKRRKHKPKDFPKRPLSAYNIFFKETRQVMLEKKQEEVGKNNVDFQSMVKEIAQEWKALTPDKRKRVEKLAQKDLLRYKDEVKIYEEEMVKKNRKEREEAAVKKQKEEEEAAEAKAADMVEKEFQKEFHESLKARNKQQCGLDLLASHGLATAKLQQQPASLEEMRLVLEQQLREIEVARELKLRQLAELQAGIIPQNLTDPASALNLARLRQGGGLTTSPSLSGASEEAVQLELLRQRQHALAASGFGGLHPGGLHSLSGSSGLSPEVLSSLGISGNMAALHGGGLAGLMSRQNQQDALLLRSLQEQEELLSSRLGSTGGMYQAGLSQSERLRNLAAAGIASFGGASLHPTRAGLSQGGAHLVAEQQKLGSGSGRSSSGRSS